MLIKSLSLRNIRSYESLNLEFPKGITLLSGDIGAGKTTLLLSIEFALFGILRPDLTGEVLLRKGASEGEVILTFIAEGNEITIRRGLKSTSSSVQQTPGYLIVNGIKEELTPLEMKSKVLSLLGYPESLISKSKSLIYRYTVYTPQSEMSRIVFESSENRLEILRKLFDMDKYKTIKNNASLYIRRLKQKITELEIRTEDLPALSKEIESAEKEMESIRTEIQKEKQEEDRINKELLALEETLKKEEESFSALLKLKSSISAKESHLSLINSNISNYRKELADKQSRIFKTEEALSKKKEEIKSKLPEFNDSIENSIKNIKESISKQKTLDSKHKELRLKKLNEKKVLESEIANHNKIIKKINSLNECPSCLQEVPHTHKDKVSSLHLSEIEKKTISIRALEEDLSKIESNLSKISANIEKLNALERELLALSNEMKSLDLLKEHSQETANKIKNMETELEQTKEELDLLKEKLSEFPQNEETILNLKEEKNKKTKELNNCRISLKNLEYKSGMISKTISSAKEKIRLKNLLLEEKRTYEALREWMENSFLNTVEVMERKRMLSLYHEFNSFFTEFFKSLIEDESFNVSIAEDFSPLVEQNSHDLPLQNLSGGEKTSISLAYRLALNKIINSFMSNIKTKGTIILDEPTEGFSNQQLAKMRDLFESLDMKQIIIVSHESIMESAVDFNIRITKTGHASAVQN